MKKILSICLLLILMIALTACGAASKESNTDYYGGHSTYSSDAENNSPNNIVVIDTKGKIVYTADYSVYSDSVQITKNTITTQVLEIGGYISNSEENETRAYITYKVPTEKLNEFLDFMDKLEGVGNKKVSTDDITNAYSETQGRIETLEASKQAYEKLLQDEKLSYSEIIQINRELVEINSELAKYQNIKANYDNKLDYSRVTVTIYQNSTYKQPSFFEEYLDYLGEFFVGLGKWILYAIPVLLVLFGVFAAIFFPIYSNYKKKKKNSQNEESK